MVKRLIEKVENLEASTKFLANVKNDVEAQSKQLNDKITPTINDN
jgi:hypothetical protein